MIDPDSPAAVTVLVPAYNEENAIAPTIDAIRAAMDRSRWRYEIIVIDDGSTDRTAERVGGEKVRLVRHPTNRGYGAALKTGLRRAQYPLVAITDADGTYPNEDLPLLLEALDDADMIVGERSAGGDANDSPLRRFAKRLLGRLASFMVDYNIPDLNSGFRIFRRDIALEFMRLYPSGFSFTSTITLAMITNDYIVRYHPIRYFRREGTSKIRPVRDTYNFILLIIFTIMYFRPLKVFLPVSFVLLAAGLVRAVYNTVYYQNLTTADLLLIETGVILGALGLLADLIDKRR